MEEISVSEHEYLPFFVYGTLMSGFGNHDVFLKEKAHKVVQACIYKPEFAMLHLGYFPGIFQKSVLPATFSADDSDGILHGQLVYVPKSDYEAVKASLDRLEGYSARREASDNHYNRQKVTAYAKNGDFASLKSHFDTLTAISEEKHESVRGDSGAGALPEPASEEAWIYICNWNHYTRCEDMCALVADGDWAAYTAAHR